MLRHAKFQNVDTITCRYNEAFPISVTHVYQKDCRNLLETLFASLFKSSARKKERKKKEWQLQSFRRYTQTEKGQQLLNFLRYAQTQKERQRILSTYFFNYNYNDVSQFYVDTDLRVFDYMKKIFVVISSIIFMVTQI